MVWIALETMAPTSFFVVVSTSRMKTCPPTTGLTTDLVYLGRSSNGGKLLADACNGVYQGIVDFAWEGKDRHVLGGVDVRPACGFPLN